MRSHGSLHPTNEEWSRGDAGCPACERTGQGTLDLPGGFIDMYETAEEGMRREIEEETGLKVEQIQYLFSSPNVYLYSGMGVHTLDMDYIARVPEDIKVHAGDDAAACVWIPLDEINPDEFGLTSIRHAVIRFLAQRTP